MMTKSPRLLTSIDPLESSAPNANAEFIVLAINASLKDNFMLIQAKCITSGFKK